MSILISVVICTYNRSDLLQHALQTVCQQTLDPAEYEVIIVDNNSTDASRDVAESFLTEYANVRYCLEEKLGLSHARNRGWQEAKGEMVAYIDDDVTVPPEWLQVAKEVVKNISPDVLSGPSLAFYNTPKPSWFKDQYGSHVAYQKALVTEGPKQMYGHNLFLRRGLLARSGGFDPTLGMIGDQIAYSEESALLRYIHATEPDTLMYYEPDIYVYHLVRPEKMTWPWLVRNNFIKGRYNYRAFTVDKKKPDRPELISELFTAGLYVLWDILFLSHFRNREKQPYWQNYLYESSLEHIRLLGRRYERCWAMQRGIE